MKSGSIIHLIRCILCLYGINTYKSLNIYYRIVIYSLQWISLIINYLLIMEIIIGLNNGSYGFGKTILEIEKPLINVCIIHYLAKRSYTICDLITFTIGKKENEKIDKIARNLFFGWLTDFLCQILRSLICLHLFGAKFILEQHDYSGVIKKYPKGERMFLILILIRFSIYETGLRLASASLYAIIYHSIQLNYQSLVVKCNNDTLSQSICLGQKFAKFRAIRAAVNEMMSLFERTFNLLPFLWISSIFIHISVQLIHYNFTNWNGLKIFFLFSSSRTILGNIFLSIIIALIIHRTEKEKSLIDRFTNYSLCQRSFTSLTSHSIGRKLYFMTNRTNTATIYDMFAIKREMILHFLGTIITFSIMFKGMFETEFKILIKNMASKLNMSLIK